MAGRRHPRISEKKQNLNIYTKHTTQPVAPFFVKPSLCQESQGWLQRSIYENAPAASLVDLDELDDVREQATIPNFVSNVTEKSLL